MMLLAANRVTVKLAVRVPVLPSVTAGASAMRIEGVLGGMGVSRKARSPPAYQLVPLAAMARPRWRDQIIWQACEIVYFASVWWYLAGELDSGRGGDAGFYWIAIGIRIAGELYLCAIIVRDILRPVHDPVSRQVARPTPLVKPAPPLRSSAGFT